MGRRAGPGKAGQRLAMQYCGQASGQAERSKGLRGRAAQRLPGAGARCPGASTVAWVSSRSGGGAPRARTTKPLRVRPHWRCVQPQTVGRGQKQRGRALPAARARAPHGCDGGRSWGRDSIGWRRVLCQGKTQCCPEGGAGGHGESGLSETKRPIGAEAIGVRAP